MNLNQLPFYQSVLLLQGPTGYFFSHFARLLEGRGARVTKVNFNSGDDWYYRRGDILRFNRPMAEWPAFLEQVIAERGSQAIFLFGDCRKIHREACEVARARGCAVWVFEEGYIRPNYITLERGGVNAYSSLASLRVEELRAEPLVEVGPGVQFPNAFRKMGWRAFRYFALMHFGSWRYPHYQHHKPTGWTEGFRWIRCWYRKRRFRVSEAAVIGQILSPERKNRVFVFPLQVHNDAQMSSHSDWAAISNCLKHVLASFARHAAQDDWLVIKHHPLDPGHVDYSDVIAGLVAEMNLAGRLHYVHDIHLPTLLDHCKGLVTVNSTAGLQGLHHKVPVITLGRAFYDKPGLTYQDGLDSFWTTDWKPDLDLYQRFRAWTIARTQINSSFYADPTCGVRARNAAKEAEVAYGPVPVDAQSSFPSR